jgi:hypothetical protein
MKILSTSLFNRQSDCVDSAEIIERVRGNVGCFARLFSRRAKIKSNIDDETDKRIRSWLREASIIVDSTSDASFQNQTCYLVDDCTPATLTRFGSKHQHLFSCAGGSTTYPVRCTPSRNPPTSIQTQITANAIPAIADLTLADGRGNAGHAITTGVDACAETLPPGEWRLDAMLMHVHGLWSWAEEAVLPATACRTRERGGKK